MVYRLAYYYSNVMLRWELWNYAISGHHSNELSSGNKFMYTVAVHNWTSGAKTERKLLPHIPTINKREGDYGFI